MQLTLDRGLAGDHNAVANAPGKLQMPNSLEKRKETNAKQPQAWERYLAAIRALIDDIEHNRGELALSSHAHSARLHADELAIHPEFIKALTKQCEWLDPAVGLKAVVDVLLATGAASISMKMPP